jgi:hypothetical protein
MYTDVPNSSEKILESGPIIGMTVIVVTLFLKAHDDERGLELAMDNPEC